MRSAAMILALLLVLGGVFYFVILRDRPPMYVADGTTRPTTTGPASRRVVPATARVGEGTDATLIRSSSGVRFQSLDREGNVAKEYQFERLDPRGDDLVDVTHPRAWFHNANGGMVTLEGTNGTVVYSQAGSHADPQAVGSATPSSGVLEHVTIRMFDNEADAEPSLTAIVPKVHFDATDNRVATVDSVVDGHPLPAEQVPVKVRGRDYEFDGRGLTLRWNDRDGRLEQLHIVHGERLLIRDASKFGAGSNTPAATQPAVSPTVQPTSSRGWPTLPFATPGELLTGLLMPEQPTTARAAPRRSPAAQRRAEQAAAERAAAEQAAAATRPARQAVLYYARFEQNVRVFRSGEQLATADTMNVILPLGEQRTSQSGEAAAERADAEAARKARDSGSLQPATPGQAGEEPRGRKSAARREAAADVTAAGSAATKPATRPARRRPATPATTQASTRPTDPIEIRWTGPLDVRPAEAATLPARGGKMVEFVGSPARVTQAAGTIEARLIHAEPDGGLARIEPGGPVREIALGMGEGSILRSPSALLVDRRAGVVTIEGPGTLVSTTQPATRPISQPDDATQPVAAPRKTSASWGRRMELRLASFGDATDGPQWLQRATLEGDADIESDAFTMSGDRLTFGFDQPDAPPTTAPAAEGADAIGGAMVARPDVRFLRLADARGNARIESGDADDRRTLVGDAIHLGLEASNGGAALTSVLCDGNVAMADAKGSEFYAQHLDVGTEPIAIVADAANGTTRPALDGGASPTASLALIDRLDARGGVRLRQPDGTTAEGDAVRLDSATGRKLVTLTGTPARAGNARATLAAATLELDPATNDAHVPGPGQLTSADAGKPNSTSGMAWTQSLAFAAASAQVDVLGDIVIDRNDGGGNTLLARADRAKILLAQSAATRPAAVTRPTTASAATTMPSFDSVQSVQLDGAVDATFNSADLRESNVQAPTLSIDVANNLVTADKPGRMKMIDHHPPATKPTTQSATLPATQPTAAPPVVQPTATMPTPAPTTAPTSQTTTSPATKPVEPASAMAVAWKDRLRWDTQAGQLTMTGGVRVGYERRDLKDHITIDSRMVIATLTPFELAGEIGGASAATKPGTTKPATTRAASTQPTVELKHVRAIDNVRVTSRRATFDAALLDYDLSSDLAYASGDEAHDVHVLDANAGSNLSFSRMTWNVKTGAIEDFRDFRGQMRR